jgi:hypothetical protein
LKNFFKGRKRRGEVRLSTEEIEVLQRENLEAIRENGSIESSHGLQGNRAIDNVSSPGVVSGMAAIVARTAQEQRRRNQG